MTRRKTPEQLRGELEWMDDFRLLARWVDAQVDRDVARERALSAVRSGRDSHWFRSEFGLYRQRVKVLEFLEDEIDRRRNLFRKDP